MNPFFKKENAPDFSDPAVQKAFVENTVDAKELLQKELDVNQAEQVLLKQRIQLAKSFVNDLPSYDPQHSTLLIQIQMDQIELDELKSRELFLIQELTINE